MPSIIIISDVHGSTNWKKLVAQRKPGDCAVFLGDYFDRRGRGPFARSQTENFLEICGYARGNPDTILLTGNHDYDYMYCKQDSWLWDIRDPQEYEYRDALLDNLDLLQMVHVSRAFVKPVIFCHGGLTDTFMRINGITAPEEVDEFWRGHPELFNWLEHDPVLGLSSNSYGDDPWQPPTWVRDQALREDGAKGYDQIVGHTPVRHPQNFHTRHGDNILMTCTLDDQPVVLDI